MDAIVNSVAETILGSLFASGYLVDANAVVVPLAGAKLGCSVWTVPYAGDTVTVSYSLDNGVTYTNWPNGAVTAASSDVLTGAVTHIKFQRTAGTSIKSTYGITQ